jgi:hypothetical protein
LVGEKAGAENQAGFFAEVRGEPLFEILMQLQITVQKAGAGAARTKLIDGALSCRVNSGMMRQAQIVIGTDHHTAPAVSDYRGTGGRLDCTKEGVESGCLNFLGILKRTAFFKKVSGHRTPTLRKRATR